MAASKSTFKPTRVDPPKRTGPGNGAGRTYSAEQLAFFAELQGLDRNPVDCKPEDEAWYNWSAPDVPKFVGLLRSFANWMTDKQDTPTGVKTRIPDDDAREAYSKWSKLDAEQRKAADMIPGAVMFTIGPRGKPRGKGAKKS